MNDLEKEFVPYELALRMKELGFDEPCLGYYSNGELVYSSHANNTMQRFRYSAPTWQSAFDWFGDKYQLYASIVTDHTSYPKYAYEIARFVGNPKDLTEKEWYWDDMILSPNLYRTKEEARMQCLAKLLPIVEEQ